MDDRISDAIRRSTRRNLSALLSGMAAVSQKRVAELIGVSETTLSGMKSDHLERFAALAAACGLKLVASTAQTVDDDHIAALETLAAMALRSGEKRRMRNA